MIHQHPNDRLPLGMRGTMSEMELSLFRQRSLEALKQKARRRELFLPVAIGYLKTSHDRIEKDPDRARRFWPLHYGCFQTSQARPGDQKIGKRTQVRLLFALRIAPIKDQILSRGRPDGLVPTLAASAFRRLRDPRTELTNPWDAAWVTIGVYPRTETS
jgi:hypothetical protein